MARTRLELRVGDLILNTITRRARRQGRDIQLSNVQFHLLEFLMRSASKVCLREAISQGVWRGELSPFSNIIPVYMQRLREKVDSKAEPKLIHGIRGEGNMTCCEQHPTDPRDCKFPCCGANQ